jgi:hypothetical protein
MTKRHPLFIVRHGRPNVGGPIPLSRKALLTGIELSEMDKLEDLGNTMRALFHRGQMPVYCSDLDRAVETAAALLGGRELVLRMRNELATHLKRLDQFDKSWVSLYTQFDVDMMLPSGVTVIPHLRTELRLRSEQKEGLIVVHQESTEHTRFQGIGYTEIEPINEADHALLYASVTV